MILLYNEAVDKIMDMNLIVAKVHRLIKEQPDDMCSLSPMQMLAMTALYKHKSLNMTQLADLLGIPRQQLTKIIDALVAREFVERKVAANNRKLVLVQLSQKGEDFTYSVYCSRHRQMLDFMEMLSDEQRITFLEAFEQIKSILFDIGLKV